jgi:hypothetical protein
MRIPRVAGVVGAVVVLLLSAGRVEAQLGALVSPGRLARAHAAIEGIANCQSCHERGQRVTAQKCLACHRPIAERISRRFGVHKDVKEDCVACHAEHAGVDGELRPFDQAAFDHAAVTGFALTGRHAPTAAGCAACHKTRSFLALSPACSSCHEDVHKGALGTTCTTCHSTGAAFRDARTGFDHAATRFALEGAHAAVPCASCHRGQTYRGIAFASCTDCHQDPHRWARGAPSSGLTAARTTATSRTCTACHTTTTWRSRTVNHDTETAFPLKGRHATVDCAKCHTQPALKVKPRSDTCAACHADVHRGAFREDCGACHNESGFRSAPFDHAKTAFALTGAHDPLACVACHKRTGQAFVDFRGLSSECTSCHADPHRGELGATCQSCHSTTTFRLPGYVHPRLPEFFAGRHATVTCGGCHVPDPLTEPIRSDQSAVRVRYRAATTACASCHRDVHLGQTGADCERCHTVEAAAFRIADFPHARTAFPLTGKHATVACAACHTTQTATFPAGHGTAVRWSGLSTTCSACHADVHLGQLGTDCGSCHRQDAFRVPEYRHRRASLDAFFVGRHRQAACEACHPRVTSQFPSGAGTAVRYQTDTRCVSCHTDVHRGSLGPDCARCHKP